MMLHANETGNSNEAVGKGTTGILEECSQSAIRRAQEAVYTEGLLLIWEGRECMSLGILNDPDSSMKEIGRKTS